MVKWEYIVTWNDFSLGLDAYSRALSKFGKEGWDNYFTYPTPTRIYHYFKRPIPETEPINQQIQ